MITDLCMRLSDAYYQFIAGTYGRTGCPHCCGAIQCKDCPGHSKNAEGLTHPCLCGLDSPELEHEVDPVEGPGIPRDEVEEWIWDEVVPEVETCMLYLWMVQPLPPLLSPGDPEDLSRRTGVPAQFQVQIGSSW